MCSDEKQSLQIGETNQHTVKVDDTNIRNASRLFEKEIYKSIRTQLSSMKNKPGRPRPIPKGAKKNRKTK